MLTSSIRKNIGPW